MNVGITGQTGFIGYHLNNYLSLKKDEISLVPFEKSFFEDPSKLKIFLSKCDILVHLAGKNRGSEKDVYDSNVKFASLLVQALEECQKAPFVIFASSSQEERDNAYGRSKKEATILFIDWASKNNGKFVSLLIPNVFGPFCRPYYNSVIATFCHQLTHNEEPKIQNDAVLKLIYVSDLVEYIYEVMKTYPNKHRLTFQEFTEIRVSEILSKLEIFKEIYLKNGIIPFLNNCFDVALFNTFRSYIEPNHFPIKNQIQSDERGDLVEVVKEKTGGQIFYSFTKPGKTRGNHFHRRKIERFFVLKGVASLKLRKIGSNQIIEYLLNGNEPSYVDIPIFYTHNISNIGETDLLTLFWTNELFNKEDSDTYFEIV
jgi:UDP-2-acetamido-2,6-beta-L-arabino-hexul-4-ose reductase